MWYPGSANRHVLEALARVAAPGDGTAVDAILCSLKQFYLSCKSFFVKFESISTFKPVRLCVRDLTETFIQLAPRGCNQAVEAVCAFIEREDVRSKLPITKFLSRIAPQGDERAIAAMVSVVTPVEGGSLRSPQMRDAAFVFLIRNAPKDDERVAAAAMASLTHNIASTGAIIALAHFAPGSVAALGTKLKCLDNRDWEIRRAALRALGQKTGQNKGNVRIISAVVSHLHDPDEHVRLEAVKTLGRVALRYDESAVSSLVAIVARFDIFTDCDFQISIFAILGWMAQEGDVRVMRLISTAITSSKVKYLRAQEAALTCLARLAPEGSPISDFVSSWRATDEPLADALARIVSFHDESLLADAIVRVESGGDPQQRLVAIQSLCRVAPEGDCRAIRALSNRMLDPDEHVRKAAANAFTQLMPAHSKKALQAAMAARNEHS